ncbi:MAG: Do family serine endopeptidase [Deltaproteobacteria bacterium]|nr:Do family serine endopeptidase [Deltaproteobacteria bacterium]
MFDHISKPVRKRPWRRTGLAAVAAGVLVTWLLAGSAFTSTDAPSLTEIPAPAVKSPSAGAQSLAPLAEALKPSVVNIRVTKVQKAGYGMPGLPEGSPFEDFFGRFFGQDGAQPRERRVQGAGSGVIISRDGYILTNNHVVEEAREVLVTLDDGRELEAEIVGLDPKTDLAVLKIEGGETLPGAAMGDSDGLRVGDYVMAIGNPFGLSHTVTSGIVSAKERVIGAGPYDAFIQTDASINPGNSGGPLFNMQGEVVGINTAIIARGQGIGFAIPVNTAKELIPQLVAHGQVTRGYIGVHIQPVTRELAEALELKERKGALVADVLSGGPAEEAGVKRGDVIVSFNDRTVEKSHDLPALVAAAPVGDKASLEVLRDGKTHRLTVEVGEFETKTAGVKGSDPEDDTRWGLRLQDLTPQIARQLGVDGDRGAVVAAVEPGSPAQRASLRRGDVILEVDREPVASAEDAKRSVEGKDSVLLLVQRKDVKRFVAMSG